MRGMPFGNKARNCCIGALNKGDWHLAHLSFDTPESLLQQQGEAPHLPLEPVVVIGEGPQCRLQR